MNINQKVAVYNGTNVQTGILIEIFPNVSFPKNGPNQQWITDNGVYVIEQKTPGENQKSIAVEPYYEAGHIYNNTIDNKTQQEIDADAATELAHSKASKKVDVEALWATKVAAGFTYQGNTYQIDNVSQGNMVATQARFNKGTVNSHGGYWRDQDNVKHTMTDAEVQAFFDAAFAYKSALIRNMHDLKDAIAAASDQTDLTAVDITAGWPANGV